MQNKELAQIIIHAIDKGQVKDKKALSRLKIHLSKEYKLKKLPTNQDILSSVRKPSKKIIQLLSIKPVRTLSGVAPVAIMTKPEECPHGKCIMCPGGINSYFGDVPQSYTGNEPATMRGISNNYDPYLQVFSRLWQYAAAGHNPGKIELIIMGGTFPSMEKNYQDEFVTYALKAMNDFSDLFYDKGEIDFCKFNEFFHNDTEEKIPDKREQILMSKGNSDLFSEQKRNENSWVKNVATCIETKPDFCMQKHIDQMLLLGTTRVELGVQCLEDSILKFINRGHTLNESIKATQLLKDSALKVMYHIMPGLPFSNHEKDIDMFRELFNNPDYKPDALKIYPCIVLPGTPLHKLWEKGKFVPLSTDEAAEIIAEGKKHIPKWVRIHRIQRDIPVKYASSGIDKNNLRQLVEDKLLEKGIKCQCIRCREAGIKHFKENSLTEIKTPKIFVEEYDASNGTEFFISSEDKAREYLYGFCRLRIPSTFPRKESDKDTALLRELHVMGKTAGIGSRGEGQLQHKGLGKLLLEKAEDICIKQGKNKLAVISGIGAREYYFKYGYKRTGPYVTKKLKV